MDGIESMHGCMYTHAEVIYTSRLSAIYKVI